MLFKSPVCHIAMWTFNCLQSVIHNNKLGISKIIHLENICKKGSIRQKLINPACAEIGYLLQVFKNTSSTSERQMRTACAVLLSRASIHICSGTSASDCEKYSCDVLCGKKGGGGGATVPMSRGFSCTTSRHKSDTFNPATVVHRKENAERMSLLRKQSATRRSLLTTVIHGSRLQVNYGGKKAVPETQTSDRRCMLQF